MNIKRNSKFRLLTELTARQVLSYQPSPWLHLSFQRMRESTPDTDWIYFSWFKVVAVKWEVNTLHFLRIFAMFLLIVSPRQISANVSNGRISATSVIRPSDPDQRQAPPCGGILASVSWKGERCARWALPFWMKPLRYLLWPLTSGNTMEHEHKSTVDANRGRLPDVKQCRNRAESKWGL